MVCAEEKAKSKKMFFVLFFSFSLRFYLCLCARAFWCHWKSGEDVGSPGAAVTGSYELSSMGARN